MLRSGAAPKTPQWKKWLREAKQAAERGDRSWDAIQRKNEIMRETDEEALGLIAPTAKGANGEGDDKATATTTGRSEEGAPQWRGSSARGRGGGGDDDNSDFDPAQQAAPATQVQPPSGQVVYKTTM